MTLKLLLAGSQLANFQSIKESFIDEDIVVITASSAALAIFLARKNRPHLIIAQKELIDSSGENFLHELQNDEDLCNIPITLLSINEVGAEWLQIKKLICFLLENNK